MPGSRVGRPSWHQHRILRASNVGIRRANGRYVLLLNPDTLVDQDALDHLADWLDLHPDAGVAAPGLVNPDGTDQRTARSFPDARGRSLRTEVAAHPLVPHEPLVATFPLASRPNRRHAVPGGLGVGGGDDGARRA